MTTGGELTFSKRALSEIAFRSAVEVSGVRNTAGDLMSGLIGRLSRGSSHRGITVTGAGGKRVFDISLVIEHGASIFDIGAEVQSRVARRVAAMTGLEAVVNVKVTGIE